MTQPRTPDDADNGTLHNVPDGLLDTPSAERPPTADTPFVPPYAEHVDTAAASVPGAGAFAFADVPAEPVAPPAAPGQPATSEPPTVSTTLTERVRRWGAPAALVVAGLIGGMAVTGAVTNASATTPASTSTVLDNGPRSDGPTTDSGSGLTLDQLEGTPDTDDDRYGDSDSDADGHGHHGGRDDDHAAASPTASPSPPKAPQEPAADRDPGSASNENLRAERSEGQTPSIEQVRREVRRSGAAPRAERGPGDEGAGASPKPDRAAPPDARRHTTLEPRRPAPRSGGGRRREPSASEALRLERAESPRVGASRGQRRAAGLEPGDRHPERRAGHVVEPDAVEEVDRLGVAAVLAADAELEVGLGRAALLDGDLRPGGRRRRRRGSRTARR